MRNAFVAAGLALAALAAPAGAAVDPPTFKPIRPSTVGVADGTLRYEAGGKHRHDVAIRRAGDGGLVIRESSLVIAAAGGPCHNVTFTEVRCPASAGIARIRVTLNRPDSRVRTRAPLPVAVRVATRQVS